MDLCSVVLNSTPPRLINSQLVSLQPAGIFNKFSVLFRIFISSFIVFPITCSTAVLNTMTLILLYLETKSVSLDTKTAVKTVYFKFTNLMTAYNCIIALYFTPTKLNLGYNIFLWSWILIILSNIKINILWHTQLYWIISSSLNQQMSLSLCVLWFKTCAKDNYCQWSSLWLASTWLPQKSFFKIPWLFPDKNIISYPARQRFPSLSEFSERKGNLCVAG